MKADVNPVRNSSRCDSKPSGALNPTGIILKSNPAAEQRGIISNGVKELRKFSIILFFAFGILGLLVFWRRGDTGLVLCGIGLALLVCGLTSPKLLSRPYKAWMRLSLILGFLMTHLILSLMYYFVFTPIGIVMRVLGKDFLCKQFDKNATTYWIKKERNVYIKERYEKMF